MKGLIKKLDLKLSDLFLFLGLVFSLPILIERTFIPTRENPINTVIPLWLIIVSFVLVIGCFITFVILERKNELLEKRLKVIIPLVAILLLMTISIFVQSNDITTTVIIQSDVVGNIGDKVDVLTSISIQTKLVCFFTIVIVFLGVYIGLFILPKRIKSVKFIEFACFLFDIYLIVTITYSLIAEFNNYISLFKNIFTMTDLTMIDEYAPKSFLGHRNVFGTFLMFGVFSVILSQQIHKRSVNTLLGIIFFIFLLTTIYKGGIFFTLLCLIIYLIYRSIVHLKVNKKNGIINLVILGSILLIVLLIILISYLSIDSIHQKIDTLFKEGNTLKSRFNIWKTTFIILQPAWWLIGRGTWIFNCILRNCNIAAQGDYTGATHNMVLNLLALGGLPLLIGFIILYIYAIKKVLKVYNKNKNIVSSSLLILLAFTLSGTIEANWYLPFITLIGLLIISNCEDLQSTITNNN